MWIFKPKNVHRATNSEKPQVKITGRLAYHFIEYNYWCEWFFLLQNKKQRKMVREAVLKSKDPQRILEEIEKIETLGN